MTHRHGISQMPGIQKRDFANRISKLTLFKIVNFLYSTLARQVLQTR